MVVQAFCSEFCIEHVALARANRTARSSPGHYSIAFATLTTHKPRCAMHIFATAAIQTHTCDNCMCTMPHNATLPRTSTNRADFNPTAHPSIYDPRRRNTHWCMDMCMNIIHICRNTATDTNTCWAIVSWSSETSCPTATQHCNNDASDTLNCATVSATSTTPSPETYSDPGTTAEEHKQHKAVLLNMHCTSLMRGNCMPKHTVFAKSASFMHSGCQNNKQSGHCANSCWPLRLVNGRCVQRAHSQPQSCRTS
jgi:hypothetical protein